MAVAAVSSGTTQEAYRPDTAGHKTCGIGRV